MISGIQYLQAVFDESADAIVGLAPDDTVRLWNKGAEMLFGYTGGEMVGKKFYAIVPPERLAAGEPDKLHEIVRRDGFFRNYETERITKDGRRLLVSLTRTLIRDADGNEIGMSAIIRDITEKRKLERQLARAESLAAMGELAAGLAHEIRNPLAGIRGAVQVIEESLPLDDSRREVIGEIKRQVARMDGTLTDLLSFARPRPPEPRRFQMNTLISDTIALLRREPQMKNVDIAEHLDPELPEVRVDPQQMQKVLFNVVHNAAQAMPDGGTLRIASWRQAGEVLLSFEDTGVGMSPEVLKQAFRPFFTTKTSGTGVGLSISQKIVEAHGGRLTGMSRLGEGSTFTISLPVSKENA